MAWISPHGATRTFSKKTSDGPKMSNLAQNFNCLYCLAHHSFCPDLSNDCGSRFRFSDETKVLPKLRILARTHVIKVLLWTQLLPHRKSLEFMKIRVTSTQRHQVLSILRHLQRPMLLPYTRGLSGLKEKQNLPPCRQASEGVPVLIEGFNHHPKCIDQYKEFMGFFSGEKSRHSPMKLSMCCGFPEDTKSKDHSPVVLPVVNGTSVCCVT